MSTSSSKHSEAGGDDAAATEASPSADVVARLEGSQPFGSLGRELLAHVAGLGELVTVPPGATIIREGEDSGGMFTVLDGAVTIMVTVDGERLDVDHLGAGDAFGELGMLRDEPRAATVVAVEPTELLHLSLPVVESLFAIDARFGLAMARDLAVRLEGAFGEVNVLEAAAAPERIELPPRDVSRLRAYRRRYFAAAARNLVKRHRLLVDRNFPRYSASFELTPVEHRRWLDLYDATDDPRPTPFTFHTSSGTLLLMRAVEDVGVNFRHLRHLRSEIAWHPEGLRVQPGRSYQLEVVLEDVVELRQDRVGIVMTTRIHDADDELVQLTREVFAILSLEPEVVSALQESSRFGTTDLSDLAKPSAREPRLDPAVAAATRVYIPEDLGVRYGHVSGDLNFVHTTRARARLFGLPRAFVQGLCTANHVLKVLTAASPNPLQHFTITFARPVFVDQHVDVRHDADTFEVVDEEERLAAFGTHAAGGSAAHAS